MWVYFILLWMTQSKVGSNWILSFSCDDSEAQINVISNKKRDMCRLPAFSKNALLLLQTWWSEGGALCINQICSFNLNDMAFCGSCKLITISGFGEKTANGEISPFSAKSHTTTFLVIRTCWPTGWGGEGGGGGNRVEKWRVIGFQHQMDGRSSLSRHDTSTPGRLLFSYLFPLKCNTIHYYYSTNQLRRAFQRNTNPEVNDSARALRGHFIDREIGISGES